MTYFLSFHYCFVPGNMTCKYRRLLTWRPLLLTMCTKVPYIADTIRISNLYFSLSPSSGINVTHMQCNISFRQINSIVCI